MIWLWTRRYSGRFGGILESHLLAASRTWVYLVCIGLVCSPCRWSFEEICERPWLDWCYSEYMRTWAPCLWLGVWFPYGPRPWCYDIDIYNESQSTTAPRGWATPFVPSLLGTAIILLVSFILWEIRRESKGQSVLMPMSMFSQPGAKMGPIILLVVFGWWGFNTQGYFIPLFYQQVQNLSPLQTALRLVPAGISVSDSKVIQETWHDWWLCD